MSFLEMYQTQPKVTKMLMNSFQKGRLAHAYLFEGEKGTPKREMALDFAKFIYCEQPVKPCNECINCLRIDHQNHPNVILLEPDGNTLRKEQIMYLQKEYVQTSLEEGPKLYIIDQIDKMSINAANSILKFIEEPDPHVYTFLTTDHIHQILPTIKSRCQILNFQPIDIEQLKNKLVASGIDHMMAGVCSQLTNDFDKALTLCQDEKIQGLVPLIHQIGQAIFLKHNDPIVLCHQSLIDVYGDRAIIPYFLDVILIYIRDLQKLTLNDQSIVFQDYLHDLQMIVNQVDELTFSNQIKTILESKVKWDAHAFPMLLIDDLLIKLSKVV